MKELHIVTSSYVRASETIGPLSEYAELEQGITHDARIGSTSLHILIHEVVHNLITEAPALVGHMVLNTQTGCNLACFADEAWRAVGIQLRSKVKDTHGHTHHLVSPLLQHETGSRTVNATTHAHQDSPIIHDAYTCHFPNDR